MPTRTAVRAPATAGAASATTSDRTTIRRKAMLLATPPAAALMPDVSARGQPPGATIAPLHADIRVRLTPRAAREQIAAGPDETYAVRVTAPPVDGRANAALCRLIARRAGV